MVYSKVKDLPETIQRVLSTLGYTRADIELEVSESVSPAVGGGDGLRGFCCIMNIETGQFDTKMGSWGGSNAFNPNNQVDQDLNSYVIPNNVAVIKGTSGGSRPVYASITLSPNNIIKALPEKIELSPRDKWLMYTFKALTSAGRKNEWERENDKPSESDLKRFVDSGWIKRASNGACQITTEGKNVLGQAMGKSMFVNHPSRKY